MSRHEIREEVFKIIFGLDFHKDESPESVIEKYLTDSCDCEINNRERGIIAERALMVADRLSELDAEIDRVVRGWNSKSMGRAELNILRLAVFEIRYDDTVPVKVAINEAVELSKVYCGDDAPPFINGVLAAFAD